MHFTFSFQATIFSDLFFYTLNTSWTCDAKDKDKVALKVKDSIVLWRTGNILTVPKEMHNPTSVYLPTVP